MSRGPTTELELTRVPGDRRLYALEGVGTLRLEGLFSRSATAQDMHGETWRFARTGFWGRVIQATDASGLVAGTFVPRGIRRGGTLAWGGREFMLRPAGSWRERYTLADGERELLVLDGKSWGRRPVTITLLSPDRIEPGLLLFTAFVVRQLAADADSTSAASTTAATSASYSG